MTVTPKRGRAVLWPSVLDENPNEKDPRTVHTALKVIRGTKYGGKIERHSCEVS
jgi:prolyl 4-hydroxylase